MAIANTSFSFIERTGFSLWEHTHPEDANNNNTSHIADSSSIALPNGAESGSLKQSGGYENLGILQNADTKNNE